MAKRVLVVDDDRLVLATLARGLRAEGYVVDTASDGQSALEAAEHNIYDIAILDVRMPDMSGVDLAQRLKQLANMPVLFLSAYNDKDIVEAALAEGGLGYMVKPVEIPQLVPAIEAAWVRGQELRNLTDVTGQLQQALSGGRSVSTAVGIIMERHKMGGDAAFNRLRAMARSKGCKIEVIAEQLVEASEMLNSVNG